MSELWEVEQDKDNGRDCWNVCEGDQVVFTCYSAFVADRVALEHNVFRSMSDEQIKELATNMVTYYALRAQLAKAVEAMEWRCEQCLHGLKKFSHDIDKVCEVCFIKAFLDKYKASK